MKNGGKVMPHRPVIPKKDNKPLASVVDTDNACFTSVIDTGNTCFAAIMDTNETEVYILTDFWSFKTTVRRRLHVFINGP
jgi:hypothetical protein